MGDVMVGLPLLALPDLVREAGLRRMMMRLAVMVPESGGR